MASKTFYDCGCMIQGDQEFLCAAHRPEARAAQAPAFDTTSYRLALAGEGPLAFTWKDKPHRLIYDLCREIERRDGVTLDASNLPSIASRAAQAPAEANIFEIRGTDSEVLVTLKVDGTLVYGADYHPDEAARIFWQALRDFAPSSRTPLSEPQAGEASRPAEERQLLADHSVALEFVREIAAWEECPINCGNCIVCRARAWLHTPSAAPAPLAGETASIGEWAEACRDAAGLCQSEANRMEHASPGTAEHWRSVATRLRSAYLAQDHIAPAGETLEQGCSCGRSREWHEACLKQSFARVAAPPAGAEPLSELVEAYRRKRKVDGLNGRDWDSHEHWLAEQEIVRLEALRAAADKE